MDPEELKKTLMNHLSLGVEVESFSESTKVTVRLYWDGREIDSARDCN